VKGREDIASLVFPAFQRPSGRQRPLDGLWARLRTPVVARAGWSARPLAASLLGLVAVLGACTSPTEPAVVAPIDVAAPGVGVTATAPALFDDRLPPPPQATEHTPAPWPFDVKHYAIELLVKPEEHAIAGVVMIDVDDAADGLTAITLDAVDMTIDDVTIETPEGPQPVPHAYDGRKLTIQLPEPRRTGTSRRIHVRYETRPTRGVYFNDGDPPQVYSQSEMEDARHWFPCHDFPDDRATSEILVYSWPDWHVSGAGQGDRSGSGAFFMVTHQAPWRYRLDVPHVSYLISMTAGEYEVIEEKGVVPLQYVVEKRDAPYAAANFKKTDAVLRFLGEWTGLPYPYPKYAQTCVRNFMYGGMENISATTLTDHTIHPPDWEPVHDSTSLVAHEAAHQWFGDWITSADWSHCWLNEGFATYFDLLFTEKDEGRDAFLWRLRGERHGALGAMDHERRALVSNRWADPDEMFDGHAYAGGAVRLHMLRHLLGDETFQGAIRHYTKKCALQCVTTEDFEEAVEEYTGRDLTWFFDQWFRKPGYPVLKVRWSWDETKKAVLVTVEQAQRPDGGAPEAYRLPLDVVIGEGYPVFQRLDVSKRSETFSIPHPSAPTHVRFDPDTALFARFDLGTTTEQCGAIAATDKNLACRLDAIETLGAIVRDDKKPAEEREAAFGHLLRADPKDAYAPLRAAWLGQVASRKDEGTAKILIDALNSDADLRIRLAASDALHGFAGNAKALEALAARLDDPNDLLRASAVLGVAKLRHPQAFDVMTAQVERPGWHSAARVAALRGLGELGDERAFATFVRFAAPGDNWSRGTAIEMLGRLGANRPAWRDAVLPYLDDGERHVRQAAAAALGAMGDPEVIPALCAHFATETWPSVKEALRHAVKACRAKGIETGRLLTIESVRGHDLREHHASLRDEADSVAKSLKELTGDAKTSAEAHLASLRDRIRQTKHDLDVLGVPEKAKAK
jgi:aminopeptidase N